MKMKMKKKVNYKCKDNDVRLQFHCKDGVIDEVWVQIDGEKSWTVIGYNDLINGIKKAESESKLYTVHVICWDGVEYTREATKDEIDAHRKNGHVKEDRYGGITFDFRFSHGS